MVYQYLASIALQACRGERNGNEVAGRYGCQGACIQQVYAYARAVGCIDLVGADESWGLDCDCKATLRILRLHESCDCDFERMLRLAELLP